MNGGYVLEAGQHRRIEKRIGLRKHLRRGVNMSFNGTLRPGHAQMRVLDMKESVKFYKEVLGLIHMGSDKSGREYFKAWDERDHHSVILRQADKAGLDFLAFKVLNKQALDKMESELKAYGIHTERVPAGELLETGERVRFEIPSGHTIELYVDKKVVGNGLPNVNPEVMRLDLQGIAPSRMDHALLYGPNVKKVHEIFEQCLGFYLVERALTEDGKDNFAVWLSVSNKAHDIAFVEYPESGKIHHLAFLLDNWEHVLRAADLMSITRTSIDMGPTRHGITRGTTIYAFDPSGNRFETFCGGYQSYPDWEPITWTFDQLGAGIFYHDRKLNEAFLGVVT